MTANARGIRKEAARFLNDPETVFVDTRSEEDYRERHVKSAVLLPEEDVEERFVAVQGLMPEDSRIHFGPSWGRV